MPRARNIRFSYELHYQAWYWTQFRADLPHIHIASHPGNGSPWTIAVGEAELTGGKTAVYVRVMGDSFAAFLWFRPFFTTLAVPEPGTITIEDITQLLITMGGTDNTRRDHQPGEKIIHREKGYQR